MPPIHHKIVVILSGGMDSLTLVEQLHRDGKDVNALTFNYGQKHSKEVGYAKRACKRLMIPQKMAYMETLKYLLESALTKEDTPVPHGHYEEASMMQTVVPNRNMIMLSVAAGYAASIGATAVAFAAHAGDHAIYPDCRPKFLKTLNATLTESMYDSVEVIAPYLTMTKGDIAKVGMELGILYHAHAWTCYEGKAKACGKCGACVERAEALEFAGYDPEVTLATMEAADEQS